MQSKSAISFKPKQVSKKLLSSLNSRMKDIINNRYGLEREEKMTLESIGKNYDVTRERVRQIENFALSAIKKSEEFKEHEFIFEELREIMRMLGSVVKEDTFLNHISKDIIIQNHINLYLVLGGNFTKIKETDDMNSHWSIDDFTAGHISDALKKLHSDVDEAEILKEEQILDKFVYNLDQLVDEYRNNKEIIHKYLSISKIISKNNLGEWGKASSSHIKTRGIKDYAYIIIRRAGVPMHFKKVAEEINKTFKKRAHVATCHNELIKDSRFVLVGRGMYGLKEWGYTVGVVKDVILKIMEVNKTPMSKEDIIRLVLEKRNVKPNTILVNLQNTKYFKKDKDGKYSLV